MSKAIRIEELPYGYLMKNCRDYTEGQKVLAKRKLQAAGEFAEEMAKQFPLRPAHVDGISCIYFYFKVADHRDLNKKQIRDCLNGFYARAVEKSQEREEAAALKLSKKKRTKR